jgi:outer membrane murein-binding lipoprotein Lpp
MSEPMADIVADAGGDVSSLWTAVEALQADVTALRAEVEALRAALGG